jgi:hypothetical protein
MLTKVINATTGEEIEREMTAEELASHELMQEKIALEAEAESIKASQKAALLAKLGITDDEAKLLLS